jgi:DNA-binding Xre family transcriptional regulator
MSDNRVAELEHRLEQAEDAYDALLARLDDIENVVSGDEPVPMAVVEQLAAGVSPIRVWREHRGLSLRALAERVGISAALLSEIETGKKDGSVRTLAALARALSVTLDDLVPWPQFCDPKVTFEAASCFFLDEELKPDCDW